MFDAIPTAGGHPVGTVASARYDGKPAVGCDARRADGAEAAVSDYEAVLWTGIAVPARTPRPAIERLNSAIDQALQEAA